MSEGAWVLLAVLLLATAFGGYRATRDGRFLGAHRKQRRQGHRQHLNVLEGSGLGHDLGERATLLQFSSAFCAPCRATRHVLSDVATAVPGVVHLEVDAEQHLALVRSVGVVRTPTTLILDRNGAEVMRASGPPRKDEVLKALAAAMEA